MQVTELGRINSVYPSLFGTPRQGAVAPSSRATLKLRAGIKGDGWFAGLEEYSHIWLIWVFHHNTNKKVNSKVRPPRLDGQKVGTLATRTPHRPNPIGLSLVELVKVDHKTRTLYLAGVDLVSGTPVLDIKPYHPNDSPNPYPSPPSATTAFAIGSDNNKATDPQEEASNKQVRFPDWLANKPRSTLHVTFAEEAEQHLQTISEEYGFKLYDSVSQVRQGIIDSIALDPRPFQTRLKLRKTLQQQQQQKQQPQEPEPEPAAAAAAAAAACATIEAAEAVVEEQNISKNSVDDSNGSDANGDIRIFAMCFDTLNVVFEMTGNDQARVVAVEYEPAGHLAETKQETRKRLKLS